MGDEGPEHVKQPGTDDPKKPGGDWLSQLLAAIPKLKTQIQLGAFAIVVLVLIIQFAQGLSVFTFVLCVVAIIPVMLTPAVARLIEVARERGRIWLAGLLALLLFAFFALPLILAFVLSSLPGPISVSGGPLQGTVDMLEDNEHVPIEVAAALEGVTICADKTFQGTDVGEVLRDIAFSNRDCIVVAGDGRAYRLEVGPMSFHWSAAEGCDRCA